MLWIFFFLGEILSYNVKGYPRTADAMRPGKNDRYASARGIEFREAGKPRTIAIRTLESLLPPKSNPGQVMYREPHPQRWDQVLAWVANTGQDWLKH